MFQFVDWLVTISTTLYTYLSTDLESDVIAIYMAYGFSLLAVLILIAFCFSLVPLLFKLISSILSRSSRR